MPSEVGDHATYDLAAVGARSTIRSPRARGSVSGAGFPSSCSSTTTSPTIGRYMLKLCEMMRADTAHSRLGGAGDPECARRSRPDPPSRGVQVRRTLFAGIELFDADMLRSFNKKQNLGQKNSVLADIEHAERLGVAIAYGYLFDPIGISRPRRWRARSVRRARATPADACLSQRGGAARGNAILLGGARGRQSGWPISGCATSMANCSATPIWPTSRRASFEFIENLFRRPWVIVGRWGILLKTVRRIARSGSWDPIRWYVIAAANLHCFVWSKTSPSMGRTYRAGDNALDPQYLERPADISPGRSRTLFRADRAHRQAGPAGGMAEAVSARTQAQGTPCRRAGGVYVFALTGKGVRDDVNRDGGFSFDGRGWSFAADPASSLGGRASPSAGLPVGRAGRVQCQRLFGPARVVPPVWPPLHHSERPRGHQSRPQHAHRPLSGRTCSPSGCWSR